ncbi:MULTISPECIES: hypothetical protein [Empedobacter]|uniref:hypothetical protein n=1 Tax=Empedobacter TaxID=59734 RepID=UPI000EED6000|nr:MULTISPECIES: hypothetical protein [Empedobacter]HAD79643.1 hypothetical protein [Flavobacteriaceae bacterium]MDH1882212.1 hypothetical protein [Empedobacter sp. GD03797]MDM1042284.1 hypothetical protein [Empedobacter brevis]MDM1136214.1 hypothetical protein [Empedobacter sp. R750]MDM1138709.1 hypothetical protein [Empedobacter sp. R132-2]
MISKRYYNIILAIIILIIPVVFYMIINTMVSIKYETDGVDTCISTITGKNLCSQIDQLKVTIYIDMIVMIFWLALKNLIVKK